MANLRAIDYLLRAATTKAIDAKDKGRTTNWERLRADIVMPVLQARSMHRPQTLIEGGDYSYFKRFESAIPDWLPRPDGDHELTGANIRLLLMERFKYSSDSEPGLELVDIVTNAARRAMTGTLKISGWGRLPTLMIHRRRDHYIQLIPLHDRKPQTPPPYAEIISKHFTCDGRSMIAPRFWKSDS